MESANNSFNVHAYCLMPDHLLAEGIEPTSDPLHFVKFSKLKVADSTLLNREASFGKKGFYDHVLRSLESVESVAWYILNPVRKDLVERPHEYAFAGSCTGRNANGMEWVPWKRRNCPDP